MIEVDRFSIFSIYFVLDFLVLFYFIHSFFLVNMKHLVFFLSLEAGNSLVGHAYTSRLNHPCQILLNMKEIIGQACITYSQSVFEKDFIVGQKHLSSFNDILVLIWI